MKREFMGALVAQLELPPARDKQAEARPEAQAQRETGQAPKALLRADLERELVAPGLDEPLGDRELLGPQQRGGQPKRQGVAAGCRLQLQRGRGSRERTQPHAGARADRDRLAPGLGSG
jgi:hypothetical protein